MQTIGAQHVISLIFDARVAIEAMIVNRWSKTPVDRQQDWLRGLVIGGFHMECQALRAGQGRVFGQLMDSARAAPADAKNSGYARWLTAQNARHPSPSAPPKGNTPPKEAARCAASAITADRPGREKPFAALSQVIG